MAFVWLLIFNILYFLFSTSSITNAELIVSLPGQSENITFQQYSDYIVTDDSHGRALFYYFVEAQSKNALPLPLTLWLNGGPGCSSIGLGLFMENGPFRPGKDGNLIKNEFSWNLESNMLYLESPIGVGYSYSNTSSDYVNWNDTMTANENMKFLLKWFEKFPEYKNHDLYLAGDSYAGHFVPQLAALVLEYNRKPNVEPIKLKGIALGNPLLDIVISVDSADFLWYHGAISAELRTMKKTLCNGTRFFLEYSQEKPSKDCQIMVAKMDEELGNDFDTGDLLLTRCVTSNSTVASETSIGDPCLYDRINAYLNNPQVQKALHANTTGLPYVYDACEGPLKYQMDNLAINIMPTLSALLKENIPILLYSGDQDTKVPVTQTRKLASMLARSAKLTTLQKNGPWYNGFQIGGWSQAFGKLMKGKNVTYLTFATVRGGAHMVPFTSPSEALTLFKAFIKGSPPPRTSPN